MSCFIFKEMDSQNSFIDIDNESIDVEVSHTVWNHFTKTNDKSSAVCSICKKSIKTEGGSTSGLHTHLKAKHNIVIAKANFKGTFICPMSQYYMCILFVSSVYVHRLCSAVCSNGLLNERQLFLPKQGMDTDRMSEK